MIRPDIYVVRRFQGGFLALMPRPRAGNWLVDEITGLREFGVDVLVSLLEPPEALELGLADEAALSADNDMEFLNYPIADLSTPTNIVSFCALVETLVSRTADGLGVAMHCRAGIGRSGLLASSVLVRLGAQPSEAFAEVSKARGLVVPDTEEQIQWLEQNWRQLRAN